MEPSTQMQQLSARLQEVEERASLGASHIHSAATTALSVLEVPLVSRQEEFGALVSEYQAARMGQTRVVSILGEAGIGKTRLAEGSSSGLELGGGRPRRVGLGGSRVALRAAHRGNKAAHGAREGSRRPLGECVALRALSALARAQGEVP